VPIFSSGVAQWSVLLWGWLHSLCWHWADKFFLVIFILWHCQASSAYNYWAELRLAVQAVPPIATHFFMSVCRLSHSCPCLNRLTDLDAIWQVHLLWI